MRALGGWVGGLMSPRAAGGASAPRREAGAARPRSRNRRHTSDRPSWSLGPSARKYASSSPPAEGPSAADADAGGPQTAVERISLPQPLPRRAW